MTIAGESAGSIAVSAQMASPLSKNLIAGAIGESGSILGALSAVPLAEIERRAQVRGQSARRHLRAPSRAMTAEQLLEATAKPGQPGSPRPWTVTSSRNLHLRFLRRANKRVPLLAGVNSEEMATCRAGPREAGGRKLP